MRRQSSRITKLCLMVSLTACAACASGSSPYDRGWVANELTKKTGSAMPDREADVGKVETRFVASLPPGVKDLSTITEGEAVSVALWNSAQFRGDLAQLGFTRGDLAEAAALPNPTLSFLFPVSTRQFELSALYPVSTLLQRPWRVAMAKLDVERVARSLLQSGLDFVRDVRIAWAEAAAARQRRELRIHIDELGQKSTALAQNRLTAGDVSSLEAELVRAESLAAADANGRGTHEAAIAEARLRMLLGLADSDLAANLGVRFSQPAPLTLPPPLDRLEKIALAARPDVRASEIAIESAGERAGLEKARIAQFSARLDAKPIGPGGGGPVVWPPGVQADIPIFNQNPGGRMRAAAELERAAWVYLTTKQQVLTDVRLAREELVMAIESSEPWSRSIVPLQERNVAAVLRAYEGGAEPYFVVVDAMRRLGDARLREVELALDVRRARARLDRAMGWRIDAPK